MGKEKFLSDILEGKKTVALSGHMRPDGDCIGSCAGLYLYLRDQYPDIRADIYLEEIPEKYMIIRGTDKIKSRIDESMRYDLFICMDCGGKIRLGFSEPLFDSAKETLCIDHHIVKTVFADKNYIFPEASSTSELVYDILDKDKITLPIAEALFMGIAHDTGIFQYSCTSPETMEAAANLLRKGVDGSTIIDKTYYERSYIQNRLLGKALYDSRLLLDGKFVVSVIEKEDMDLMGAVSGDTDGIVNQLRQTRDSEVALFIYASDEETSDDPDKKIYKLSLRSRGKVDVCRIAQSLGGGGHLRAAATNIAGDADEIVDRVCEMIKEQLGQCAGRI